ncbi:alpha/beta hydrolase [Paenibacillus guangzhouensis]|uniref:alpha/beta hydrolase n=1 Tax=Paenibacillus guangzhouensis TaxID=1473112 RepID=UPI001266FFB9|nr:alpha/beta hydrolase-fold protein [Paenibacillus guangzhouensis]
MEHRSSILRIESFYSSYLENRRDLFVYLPPSYDLDQGRRYPVLYMHDGQNIFHPAFNGYSWHVHTTIDRLVEGGVIEEIIVVGIANMGMERSNEFTHDLEGVRYQDDKVDIRPLGHIYEKFLIEEVKPYMDRIFRTKPEAEHTALMGSSRGGQVTYHIGLRRPDVFSKLGIISPYLYYVDPVTLEEFPQYHTFESKQPISRIWIDLGSSEGLLIMEKHVREAAEKLAALGYEADNELCYLYAPGAAHVEKDWAARLASPLIHFYGHQSAARAVTLQGDDEVGLVGAKSRLNPIVEMENGLQMTLLRADYQVANPEILDIKADGTLVPKCVGETTITVQYRGVRASRTIRVIPETPEHVILDLNVYVPTGLPENVRMYAWFPLTDAGQGTYKTRLRLPLHTELVFQVTRTDGRIEVDCNGNTIEHNYKASADGTVDIHVVRWSS